MDIMLMKQLHSTINSCKAPRGTCGQLRKTLCGERHQEDPPMDDVAQFGGAHVRKGSGICCCIRDTLMNMHRINTVYMHVYIFYMGTLHLPRY